MDFHLERELRLQIEPEHKSLYSWAIQEIDAQGKQIGRDQIPWQWSLYFTATSCVLADNIEIESRFKGDETTPALPEIVQRQVIRARLCPGNRWADGDYFDETTFSMFGTGRALKSFQLEIHPIDDPAEKEGCSAWGSVSYTSEIDFRTDTSDDCIVFYLFVKPETFARYGAKVAHGLVDEIVLIVGSVAGFYSDWSPSVTTDYVKVLTRDSEQKINLPPGHQVEPPRLGHVGKAQLYINRRLEFRKRGPKPEAVEEKADLGPKPEAVEEKADLGPEPEAIEEKANFGTERVVSETQAPVAVLDPRMLQMLGSLRRAAWFVVCLLALILILTLLKS